MREFLNVLFKALLMGLFEPRVQLSVSRNIPYHQAHGVIHSRAANGLTEQHTFLVDEPHRLRNPSFEILEQVFIQAERLGLDPHHLEIFGERRQVYNNAGTLIFAQ